MFIGSMNADATDDRSVPRVAGHVLCRRTNATGLRGPRYSESLSVKDFQHYSKLVLMPCQWQSTEIRLI
eukprot:3680009-Rhodomonas_salina.1